ncbi:MAG: hypothetical protein EIB84_03445 [Spiroplasma poulsonii]|uniref:Uncharacterized protein n=1 Tax=Spiroplasma poulsonii TaxID=2138 RepID=A0A2P6FD23_9MOLU|nr:hypothetical protein [Spiroplasma poulsonii]KAF0850995.1 hypothetical protein MSROBK_012200 [Spiroplasma poulsonii]MBW1241914.1 hypothetical protein [Spiroplasma poulsonii]PQM31365.1 hypothetical protein SMSRO_SF011880 [Spiroplasma poulsonii]PWF96374.1 hypothetical protein SMSE_18210 [Spiroplasma poulsonii]PWF99150.1 hypothetical protein SMH99_17220 [Spiroplasma poulsonii]
MSTYEEMLLITNNSIYQFAPNVIAKLGNLTKNSYRKKIKFKEELYFFEYFDQKIIFYKMNDLTITKIKQISLPQALIIKCVNFSQSTTEELLVYYLYQKKDQVGIYLSYYNLSTNQQTVIFDEKLQLNEIFASCSLFESEYLVVTFPEDNTKKLIRFHNYQWDIIASFRDDETKNVLMMVINNYLYIAIDLVLYRMTNSLKPTLVVETLFEKQSIIGLTASPTWDNNRYFYLLLNDGSLYRNNILTNDLTLITKLTINNNVVLTVQLITFWKSNLLIAGQQTQGDLKTDILFFITQNKNITIQKLETNLNITEIWG